MRGAAFCVRICGTLVDRLANGITNSVNPVTAANPWNEESVPRFDTHDPPVPPLSPLRHSHSSAWEASHRARAKKSPSNFSDLETAPRRENPRVPEVPTSLFNRWHEMRLSIVYQSFGQRINHAGSTGAAITGSHFCGGEILRYHHDDARKHTLIPRSDAGRRRAFPAAGGEAGGA